MDFEDFLACIYTPLNSIEILTNIIYTKMNEEWNFKNSRKEFEEFISLIYCIKVLAKELKRKRTSSLKEIEISINKNLNSL